MILIHNQHDYKMMVVSMGASADRTINQAMGSDPSISSAMHLIRTMNPAAVARMNVTKNEFVSPIGTGITPGEMLIDSVMGSETFVEPRASFHWTRYQNSTLKTFIGTDAIRTVVARLADHVPDRLLNLTAVSIERLYSIMSDHDLESMIQSVGIDEGAVHARDEKEAGTTGQNVYYQATVSTSAETQGNVIINPFEQAHMERSNNQSANVNAGGGQGGYQGANKGEGPNFFTKRSQLGQMLDPTGKAVSQQTIVIDSINKQTDQILLACRQITSDTSELTKRQATVMDVLTKLGTVSDDSIEDAKNFIEEYTDHIKTVFEHMEESRGVIEALHAVVEGDRGIYEPETTPVAPLLRRDDGSAMKQFVYGPTTRGGRMNQEANQFEKKDGQQQRNEQEAANQQWSTNAVNPLDTMANQGAPGVSPANATPSLFETGDEKFLGIADKIIKTSIKHTEFDDGTKPRTVISNLTKYMVKIDNKQRSMYDVMKTIVAQKITLNSGANPSDDEMTALISCLGSGTMEDVAQCEEPFAEAVMNDTEVMNLFANLMTFGSEEESGDETESELGGDDE
jgi:hypothetical protein